MLTKLLFERVRERGGGEGRRKEKTNKFLNPHSKTDTTKHIWHRLLFISSKIPADCNVVRLFSFL